jgi:membrane fusion protein (multidrug efflux system)
MRIRVLLEERPGALLVPQAAVLESQGSASVFVVAADQTVQARTVRLGPRFETEWVVEEGVKPGEQVIVSGLQHVRAGMRVEPTRGIAPRPTGS